MKTFLLLSIGAAVVTGVSISTDLRAQSPAAAFEVAAIKRNISGQQGSRINGEPGGRVVATNMSLRGLIRNAYGLADNRITGGPAWMDDDRFDITAKADGNQPLERLRVMMRALLVDRFTLDARFETREMPIYALVLDRKDGQFGPQLRRFPFDCVVARSNVPPPSPPPNPSQPRPVSPCGIRRADGRLTGHAIELSQFAASLSPVVERVVIDQTGLAGTFDLDIEWRPDPAPRPDAAAPSLGDGPSIFSAIQEQLGLKLEAARGPVEVLVIVKAEKPAED